jgi:hypothetical protein
MIDEVIDRVNSLLTDPGVAIDGTRKEPATFENETVYVWPAADVQMTQDETGPPGRQDFNLLAVYVAADHGEEARQDRTLAVSTVLQSRRDAYIDRLQQRESCDLWDHIAVTSDDDYSSNFEGRAIAVRIQGYRRI